MRFEEFERDPLAVAGNIYTKLSISGFEEARSGMEKYVRGHKGFKKNRYGYSEKTVSLVESHWSAALEKWGYKL